jgi:separase
MGMGSRTDIRVPTLPSVEVLDALASAEKLLWAHVGIAATTGNVIKIRETAMSLVLISAFRTSLGDRTIDGPTIMAALMGKGLSFQSAITLMLCLQMSLRP